MNRPLLRFYIENRKYWPGLLIIVAFSMMSGICTTLAAALWGNAVDYGLSLQVRPMLLATGGMIIFILLDSLRTGVHYWIIGRVTEGMFFDLRERIFYKIAKGDYATLQEKFRSGDIVARVNSDIDELNGFAAGQFADFARRIFKAAFAVCACFFLSWQLSLAYCIILPLTIWMMARVSKPIQNQSKKSKDFIGRAMSTASDTIVGVLTVKSFQIENVLANKFNYYVDASCNQVIRSEKVSMRLTSIKYTVNVVQTMSLFLIGSILMLNKLISVGDLLAFINLSNYINDTISQIDRLVSSIRRASAIAQRLYEVLDISDERPGCVHTRASDIPCSMNDVNFYYDKKVWIHKDMNMKIGCNQRVALVGNSGCGKSTMVNLICRFYLPESGSLQLFGVDSIDWDVESLRQNMALVTQESFLFDGSIFDNIAYGCPGTTRQECEIVLKEVGLWNFVCQFEDGIDHTVGEFGNRLSGGQMQRICIARAMVKRAPLVILDEATSALDAQTEKDVQTALDRLMEDRSAVIVAHRLTTVQNADYIYYIEDGKVLEEGTPESLLSIKGKYYEMCRMQGLIGEIKE